MRRHPRETPQFCKGEGLLLGWGWVPAPGLAETSAGQGRAGLLPAHPAGVEGPVWWVSHVAPTGFCSSGATPMVEGGARSPGGAMGIRVPTRDSATMVTLGMLQLPPSPRE